MPTKSASAASNPYAVVCLVNNTGTTINYQYKWGSQRWKSDQLKADENVVHSWAYDRGSESSPEFKVKFDADYSDGVDYKVYRLDRYQAASKSCYEGKMYNFESVDNETIDLYDTD